MTALLPKLTSIPPQLASVADYEGFARERIAPGAWAYLAGGAGDEATLRENIAAFARISLRSRVLADVAGGNTDLTLLGCALESPILLAPVAHQSLAHPDAEAASAMAAGALGAAMVVSTQASMTLEDITANANGAPLLLQLYIQPDREFTLALAQRARAAGYRALVLTVDAPVSGPRNREQRAGFSMPPNLAVNLRGARALPPPEPVAPGQPFLLNSPLMRAAPTWRDLDWLRACSDLPILVKGVMHPDDARACLDHGADGVIVSNHGGRTLDGQQASIDALPAIIDAVDGRAPVLMDGGVRRGIDVFRALALGARAVLIGRPYVWGLGAAGVQGVAHVLRVLREEFEIAMALTGCRTLADIDESRVIRRD